MSNLQTINLKKQDKIAMGIIGAVVVGVIAVPVLTYLATITALMATIAANTTYFLLTIGALLVGGMTLWDSRTNIIYGWKSFSRNVARTITRTDPIGVLTTAIKRFEGRLEDITDNLNRAEGARKRHKKSMDETLAKADIEEALYRVAERERKPEAVLNARLVAAGRWRKAYEIMQPQYEQLTEMYQAFQKARETVIYKLEDMKNQREVLSIQYETMLASQKAAKSFKSFFGSNPDLDMLQMSVDEAERQIADAEAEIDQVISDAKPLIEANNLQKSADAEAALARIRNNKLIQSAPQAPQAPIDGQLIESTPIKQLVGRS